MKFRLVEEQQYGKKSKKQLPTFSHADLLTVEEAEKLSQKLRKYKYWWWLRSPGHSSYVAAFAYSSGSISDCGYSVSVDDGAIRPALRITNLNDYKVGSLFKFGGQWFEIVDENTAFCVNDIGTHRFDDETCDYDESEIKKYIDDWFNKNNN